MAGYHKCMYCGRLIEYPVIEEEKVGARYAHHECVRLYKEAKKRIPNLVDSKFKSHYRNYLAKGFSIDGILNSLTYWYDVKGESSDKANGGIAIIDWIYDEAQEYYKKQEEKRLRRDNITDEQREEYDRLKMMPLQKTPSPKPFRHPIGIHYIDLD